MANVLLGKSKVFENLKNIFIFKVPMTKKKNLPRVASSCGWPFFGGKLAPKEYIPDWEQCVQLKNTFVFGRHLI